MRMPPATATMLDHLLDLWADRAVAISRRYGPMPAGRLVERLWPTRGLGRAMNIGRRKASERA